MGLENDRLSWLAKWNCLALLAVTRPDLGGVQDAVIAAKLTIGVASLFVDGGITERLVGAAAKTGVEALAGAKTADKPYWVCAARGCDQRARWYEAGAGIVCDAHGPPSTRGEWP